MAKGRTPKTRLEPEAWSWAYHAMAKGTLRTPEFRAVWIEWVAYRRHEIKIPVTVHIARRAIRKMEREDWSPERAIAALRHSMDRGWRGIYEDRGPTKRSPTRIGAAMGKYDNVPIHRK